MIVVKELPKLTREELGDILTQMTDMSYNEVQNIMSRVKNPDADAERAACTKFIKELNEKYEGKLVKCVVDGHVHCMAICSGICREPLAGSYRNTRLMMCGPGYDFTDTAVEYWDDVEYSFYTADYESGQVCLEIVDIEGKSFEEIDEIFKNAILENMKFSLSSMKNYISDMDMVRDFL